MGDIRGNGPYIIDVDGAEQAQNRRLILKNRNSFLLPVLQRE
jgi:hypothetical protein